MQVTLSVRPVDGLSKDDRADIKYYTKFISCEFNQLVHMLNKDYIFSPWNYIGYQQGTHNICSEANFIVFDIDCTSISIHERLAELQAEQLQCILATTSDSSNQHKYRVLIPINRSITPSEYRLLIIGVGVNGLITDADPVSSRPAQKFYCYSEALVVSDFTGNPLSVDDYIAEPQTQQYQLLESTADVSDILHEFDSYRYATKGRRTKNLLHAAYRCLDYGLTDSQLEQVVNYVNSRFLIPKPQDEVHRRVVQFIKQQRRHI